MAVDSSTDAHPKGLLVFGLLFIVAAGSDALVLWLIRDVSPAKSVRDHPTRAGCIVIE